MKSKWFSPTGSNHTLVGDPRKWIGFEKAMTLFWMDSRGVFEEIAKVNGRFWAWAILLSSLILLAWRIGFEDPTLLEDDDRSSSKIKLRHRAPPRVKRAIEKMPAWEPSEDFLDVLLDESFRIRDIVVRFPDNDSLKTFVEAATERGLRVEDKLAKLRMVRVRLASGRQARELFDLLPDDSVPEPNYPVIAPDIPQTENVRGIAPFGAEAVDWLDAPRDRSSWGAGVRVAILDTGVDFSHPALEGVKGTSVNLVEDETDETSYDGHGTAVASIIAGNPEVIGGLAPKAEILSVRVLNSEGVGDGYTVARGIIEAVDRGADIINLSLGTPGNSF
ncbi:MAG: S8 family serine peptidase, partial [Opitutales bacterium]